MENISWTAGPQLTLFTAVGSTQEQRLGWPRKQRYRRLRPRPLARHRSHPSDCDPMSGAVAPDPAAACPRQRRRGGEALEMPLCGPAPSPQSGIGELPRPPKSCDRLQWPSQERVWIVGCSRCCVLFVPCVRYFLLGQRPVKLHS